jgi:predicted double-glycine peptidase
LTTRNSPSDLHRHWTQSSGATQLEPGSRAMSRHLEGMRLAITSPRLWVVASSLALVALLSCSPVIAGEQRLADGHRSVRSLLEIRRDGVMIQSWDLSCGAAALGTLLRYEFGKPVTEKEIARGLMRRGAYVKHPELVQIQEGFSLLDLKRYLRAHGYRGLGLGKMDLNDLIKWAPIMVPIDALGYNHFVIFRGVMGNRVLLADPAWGNRTMTIDKFERMWLDYGEPMGHVGFVVKRADGRKPSNKLQAKLSEFVMFQ